MRQSLRRARSERLRTPARAGAHLAAFAARGDLEVDPLLFDVLRPTTILAGSPPPTWCSSAGRPVSPAPSSAPFVSRSMCVSRATMGPGGAIQFRGGGGSSPAVSEVPRRGCRCRLGPASTSNSRLSGTRGTVHGADDRVLPAYLRRQARPPPAVLPIVTAPPRMTGCNTSRRSPDRPLTAFLFTAPSFARSAWMLAHPWTARSKASARTSSPTGRFSRRRWSALKLSVRKAPQ